MQYISIILVNNAMGDKGCNKRKNKWKYIDDDGKVI